MISTYRLSVMWLKVTSLTVPSTHDTPTSKGLFYAFHVLPEWLACAILLGDYTRETFGTGLFGDLRYWDKTVAKREAKSKDTEEVEMKGQV